MLVQVALLSSQSSKLSTHSLMSGNRSTLSMINTRLYDISEHMYNFLHKICGSNTCMYGVRGGGAEWVRCRG